MEYPKFTTAHQRDFEHDGYVIIKSFYHPTEVSLLMEAYRHDEKIKKSAFGVNDNSGKNTKLTLWYHAGDDIYGAFSKSERVVNGVEMLLGGPAALYHTKFMQKEAKVGGAWEWHQDYGYWYDNGFLFPNMLSVMVAITDATKKNGCLQVLRGSHKIGRINHNQSGEQVGADMRRVTIAMHQMELVYVELEPGDTLFFDGNLLHKSDANMSEESRFSLISAYNLASNRSFMEEPAASHTPIVKVPNERIIQIGAKTIDQQAEFLDKTKDAKWKDNIKKNQQQ